MDPITIALISSVAISGITQMMGNSAARASAKREAQINQAFYEKQLDMERSAENRREQLTQSKGEQQIEAGKAALASRGINLSSGTVFSAMASDYSALQRDIGAMRLESEFKQETLRLKSQGETRRIEDISKSAGMQDLATGLSAVGSGLSVYQNRDKSYDGGSMMSSSSVQTPQPRR